MDKESEINTVVTSRANAGCLDALVRIASFGRLRLEAQETETTFPARWLRGVPFYIPDAVDGGTEIQYGSRLRMVKNK